jgi:hypothetical protein
MYCYIKTVQYFTVPSYEFQNYWSRKYGPSQPEVLCLFIESFNYNHKLTSIQSQNLI